MTPETPPMTPDEARQELKAALTRARRARTKVTGGFGLDPGTLVMVTEEVAVALLADGEPRLGGTDLIGIMRIIEGWETDAESGVYGSDGTLHFGRSQAYAQVLDLLREIR